MTSLTEAGATFRCFGSTCSVLVTGDRPGATAAQAVATARRHLLEWHDQFTRFDPSSELSRLNDDPRSAVAVSPMMSRLAEAAVTAARRTGGLVDATLVDALEDSG